MYSVFDYGEMLASDARVSAYVRALGQLVKPGTVLLEIGTGTGFFAMVACQFGARKVYAIEPDDVIQLARETAAANGFEDRIEFIQDLSTQVTPTEQADVIISDIRGRLPLFQRLIPTIIDARKRLLAPGGALIPKRDTMWAAVVDAPQLYKSFTDPWNNTGQTYGFDLSASIRLSLNTWNKGRVTRDQFVVDPACWATLDYHTIDSPDVQGGATWTVSRDRNGHGLSVWFDAETAEGIKFSNAPGEPELVYRSAFFPWLEPVSLIAGDLISIVINTDLIDTEYVWRWDTRICDRRGNVKADFKQSTFLGTAFSPRRLRRIAGNYLPRLNETGVIDQLILSLMDGKTPQDDIARQILEQFPAHFENRQAALTRVSKLSLKYT